MPEPDSMSLINISVEETDLIQQPCEELELRTEIERLQATQRDVDALTQMISAQPPYAVQEVQLRLANALSQCEELTAQRDNLKIAIDEYQIQFSAKKKLKLTKKNSKNFNVESVFL